MRFRSRCVGLSVPRLWWWECLRVFLWLCCTQLIIPTESRLPHFHHLHHPEIQDAVRNFFSGSYHGFLRSVPALNQQQQPQRQGSSSLTFPNFFTTIEVSTKVLSKRVQQHVAAPLSSAGLYYGISPQSMERHAGTSSTTKPKMITDSTPPPQKKKKQRMQDTMLDTLEELRLMRLEMEALRKELHEMKEKVAGDGMMRYYGMEDDQQTAEEKRRKGHVAGQLDEEEDAAAALAKRRKRQREFDKLSFEIEKWAEQLLVEQEDGDKNGWTEVKCNKMFQNINRDGQTKAYLKWMKDSRGMHANPDDEREYPCIKMFSTIDAPLEEVCLYLSQHQKLNDYNDLLERHKDLEEISPYSKICWGQTPQILFIKPRDFVTFCSHRWLRDGTQVVVNQACKDETGKIHEGRTMAYALRGANFVSRDPDDPEKTRLIMLAHGNPGSDVPQWAVKTAVNSLAPIEPFKLFHKINQGILSCREELEQKSRRLEETEMVSSSGISRRPAGLAQLGYACFWPNGGGIQEGGAAAVRAHSSISTGSTSTTEPNATPDSSLGNPLGDSTQENGSLSSSSPDTLLVEPKVESSPGAIAVVASA